MAKIKKNDAKKPVGNTQNNLLRLVIRGTAIGLVTVVACFVYWIVFDLPTRNENELR